MRAGASTIKATFAGSGNDVLAAMQFDGEYGNIATVQTSAGFLDPVGTPIPAGSIAVVKTSN